MRRSNSLSCASAGNCGAGGTYANATGNTGHAELFADDETGDVWGTARELPGSGTLFKGWNAQMASLSCASAGNCGAGGFYGNGAGNERPFVVSETNGTWGSVRKVPGAAILSKGGPAGISVVSCGSPGNCSAGGFYTDSSGHQQALVISETNGTWGTAAQVPGTGALNKGGGAAITSLSCSSAGNCGGGGHYQTSSHVGKSFVVSETNGTWGRAEEVPGSGALNKNGSIDLISMSCASAGNCSAGGEYVQVSGDSDVFVVSETNGAWGTAEEVPGSATLNKGGQALLSSLSCGSAGNCSAGGSYTDSSDNIQAFVVSETNGAWRTAEEVPGSATLNKGISAQVSSVSCGSLGDCDAGGSYTNNVGNSQAFVASETNGTWGKAEEVPGSGTLNKGNDVIYSLSCSSADNCSAGGSYTDSSDNTQAFVVNQT